MPLQPADKSDRIDLNQRDLFTFGQLEQRRGENDRAMWLAPVITMAAQAFLLQIISNQGVPCLARLSVLLAGIAATLAACWTVARAHAREVQYSEEIWRYSEALGLPDVRPSALKSDLTLDDGGWRRLDRWLVHHAKRQSWPIPYMAWTLALLLFVVADLVVFFAT
jgi:hypothetical protein